MSLAAKILKRCSECSEGGKEAEKHREFYSRGSIGLNPENYGNRFNPNNSYKSSGHSLNRSNLNVTSSGTQGGSIGVNLTGFYGTQSH